MADWTLYRGDGVPHDDISERLPPPPPWRQFRDRDDVRASTYQASDDEIEVVNAALYLRRPILVTGNPGNGKSSLAYSVAHELNLGPVLRWSINSRSTLQEGLYQYDALARLQDANLARLKREQEGDPEMEPHDQDIGRYIRLGPLGTALLPSKKPRVLLIDEIDKSDIDLPNDLLHVFEEGEFVIDELLRIVGQSREVRVLPYQGKGDDDKVAIVDGTVRCRCFPFVVLSSNGERELPPAFLRRCLQLDIADPDKQKLQDIISAHLEELIAEGSVTDLIDKFLEARQNSVLATDQLLNAVFLITRGRLPDGSVRENVLRVVLRELGQR